MIVLLFTLCFLPVYSQHPSYAQHGTRQYDPSKYRTINDPAYSRLVQNTHYSNVQAGIRNYDPDQYKASVYRTPLVYQPQAQAQAQSRPAVSQPNPSVYQTRQSNNPLPHIPVRHAEPLPSQALPKQATQQVSAQTSPAVPQVNKTNPNEARPLAPPAPANYGRHMTGSPPAPVSYSTSNLASPNSPVVVNKTRILVPATPVVTNGVASHISIAGNASKAKAHGVCSLAGYGPPTGTCSGGGGYGGGYGGDFNPALSGGNCNAAGIKARINARGFQYASDLIAPILNQEIQRARIPPVNQCLQFPLNGCIKIYNLYVSRYRCPDRIAIYPTCPNKIAIAVQNLDIGVTGNLGGQINILIPIALFGIVQVSITVELQINCCEGGAPSLSVASCNVQVGFLDLCIQNGGLVGDLVNTQFRGLASKMVKDMLPGKICEQIPNLVNEKINSKLGGLIPRYIPVSQMANLVLGLLNKPRSREYCNRSPCVAAGAATFNDTNILVLPDLELNTKGLDFNKIVINELAKNASFVEAIAGSVTATTGTPKAIRPPVYAKHDYKPIVGRSDPYIRVPRHVEPEVDPENDPEVTLIQKLEHYEQALKRIKRQSHLSSNQSLIPPASLGRPRAYAAGICISPPGENPCAGCPGQDQDPMEQLLGIVKYLDMSKLNDILLDIGCKEAYTTCGPTGGFVIGLKGGFLVCPNCIPPFCPQPLDFACPQGNAMVEALVSDYTINSLLWSMHKRGFLSVNLTPQTPKIGPLLKTTCGDSCGDSCKTKRDVSEHPRSKRQLGDLGICLGEFLPNVARRFPNELLNIFITTERAPSVILSAACGGSATLDLVIDANICIARTGTCVGSIRVAAVVNVCLNTKCPGRITGSLDIQQLSITNPDGGLGIDPGLLDKLGLLGKELLQTAGNGLLQKGIPIQLPANLPLPINIINPQFGIINRGICLSADFTVNPSTLTSLLGQGGSCAR